MSDKKHEQEKRQKSKKVLKMLKAKSKKLL